MKHFFAIAVMFFVSATAFADQASRQSVERMLSASGAEAMVDGALAQIDGAMSQMMSTMNVPEDKKASLDNFNKRYAALVQEEITWAKLKEPMIDIYSRIYTEEEVKAMSDFFESPVGRKMVAKNPEVMQASMELMQTTMMRIMPRLQALIQELEAAN